VVTTGSVIWYESMATNAPWFLTGAPAGTSASGVTLQMVTTGTVMVVSALAAIYGSARIAGGRTREASPAR